VKSPARSPPVPRRPEDIGLAQFEVVRGIRFARVNRPAGARPLQLMRFNHGAAIAAAPAREPSERTLALVDGNAGMAEFGRDLTLRQGKMLTAKPSIAGCGVSAARTADLRDLPLMGAPAAA